MRAYAEAAGVALHEACHFCGTADARVEAGGLWYCPNETCSGCAGGQVRHVRDCKACVTRETANGWDLIRTCPDFPREVDAS